MNPPEMYRDDEEGLALLASDLRAERPEVDPEFARKMATSRDEVQRRRLERALAEGGREPRTFFW